MFPVLIKIGPITLHTYGIAIALAFLTGIIVIRQEAKRKGFDPDIAYDIVLSAMLGGVIGARLLYVIQHWREFIAKPASIFATWEGGLIFFGGLIGGTIAVLIVVRVRKLAVGKIADIVAPALALGTAIGRLGCFANGCCYGKPTDSFIGIVFANPDSSAYPLGIPLYPTQIFEFTYNVIILAILWIARKRFSGDGLIFWLYITLYGLFRFIVEFFRADPIALFGMSASQIFSAFIFIAGSVIILRYYFLNRQLSVRRLEQ